MSNITTPPVNPPQRSADIKGDAPSSARDQGTVKTPSDKAEIRNARIERLPERLESDNKEVRVRGEVVKRNSDGRVEIKTPRGSVEVRVPPQSYNALPPGENVEVVLPQKSGSTAQPEIIIVKQTALPADAKALEPQQANIPPRSAAPLKPDLQTGQSAAQTTALAPSDTLSTSTLSNTVKNGVDNVSLSGNALISRSAQDGYPPLRIAAPLSIAPQDRGIFTFGEPLRLIPQSIFQNALSSSALITTPSAPQNTVLGQPGVKPSIAAPYSTLHPQSLSTIAGPNNLQISAPSTAPDNAAANILKAAQAPSFTGPFVQGNQDATPSTLLNAPQNTPQASTQPLSATLQSTTSGASLSLQEGGTIALQQTTATLSTATNFFPPNIGQEGKASLLITGTLNSITLPDQAQPFSQANTTSSALLNSPPSPLVTGIIEGHTAQGQAIVNVQNQTAAQGETPINGQFVIEQGGRDLPKGTSITLENVKTQVIVSPSTAGSGATVQPSLLSQTTAASDLPPQALPFSWPVLTDILNDVLPKLADDQSKALLSILPSISSAASGSAAFTGQTASPARFAAQALFFIAALRSGDVSNWIGGNAEAQLKADGKSDLLGRLIRDFTALARQSGDIVTSSQGDWRGFQIPILFGLDLSKLNFYVRPDPEHNQNKEKQDSDKTRFVMDFSLSRMGDMQLDSMISKKRMDTILRTEEIISSPMRQDMRQRYQSVMRETGLDGTLDFQDAKSSANWISFENNLT